MMKSTSVPDDGHDNESSFNDEVVGLIPKRTPRRDMEALELEYLSEPSTDDARSSSSHYSRSRSALVLLGITVAAVLSVLVHGARQRRAGLPLHAPPSVHVAQYQCPKDPVAKSKNDKGDNFDDYIEQDAKILSSKPNESDYNNGDFRQSGYDGFTMPYEEAKANVFGWKGRNFAPALKSGYSIYESACGTAMNLLMTIEILAELNITDLHVYGNEYVPASVAIARRTLSQHAPRGTHIGNICPGDSTHLFYVPSASFDLVYTGYIDPLMDPLGLSNATVIATDETSVADDKSTSLRYCKSDDPHEQLLAKREQAAQEDWFALWVSEMLRIVKPGGTVAVEEVAKPMCDLLKDWGGVSQEWWAEAVTRYGWDVEGESIHFEDAPRNSPRYKGRRYNVAMRKKL